MVGVCRQLFWDGWVGSGGVLLVSCSCVYSSEWLSFCCTIPAVSATGLVCTWKSVCRYAPLCEGKKEKED